MHLLRRLLPTPCLACAAAESRSPGSSLGLCPRCAARLKPLAPGLCRVCAREIPGLVPEAFLCGECRRQPPSFDRLVACFAYAPPLDAVIGGLKFRRLEYLGELLAAAMARHLGDVLEDCDCIVPVPLHWRRRLMRGFNQAEAIAEPLARGLRLPFSRALRRRLATGAQTRLHRGDRLRNLRGAFAARPGAVLAGARVALIDDVVTTSATAEAASRALKSAGAGSVIVLAVARTMASPYGSAAPGVHPSSAVREP